MKKTILRVEACEERLAPAAAIDSAYEAYSWVLVNTLRTNPTAFANNLQGLVGGTVGSAFGFAKSDPVVTDLKGMISRATSPANYSASLTLMRNTPAAGPLAWDDTLEARADLHNEWMKANGYAHTGTTGNRNPIPGFSENDSAPADVWGYGSPAYTSMGENIGWAVGPGRASKAAYNTGTINLTGLQERQAFLDTVAYMLELNSPSLGHLRNLLGRDSGIAGTLPGLNVFGLDTDLYQGPAAYEVQDNVPESWLSTHRFALSRPGGSGGFVAGVAFRDDNWNGFYDAGEGAGLTVSIRTALGVGVTVPTGAHGAFSEFLPNGTYTVTFSAGAQTLGSRTVTVNNTNAWAPLQIGGMTLPDVTGPTGSAGALRPTVTWTAVDAATGYQVRVDDRTTGKTNLFANAPATGTSWAPPADLVSGHTYRVWVRAARPGAIGAWGAPADFKVALPAPQPLAAAVADIRPNFAWSAVSGTTRYQVQVDDVSAGRVNIFPGATTTATSWEAPTDLVSGRTYRWKVRAVNADGLGTWGPAGTFAVARPTHIGPAGTANPLRPTFSWTGVAAAAGYEVRVLQAGVTRHLARVSTTSWVPAADLVSGGTYTWQVRALNSLGQGAWSPAATLAIARPTLTGPIGTTGSPRPTFTWTGVGGAGSYEVRVDDATTGRVRLFAATVGSLSWVPPSDLTAGHTYRWYVRALNADGLGVWSPAGTFRVV